MADAYGVGAGKRYIDSTLPLKQRLQGGGIVVGTMLRPESLEGIDSKLEEIKKAGWDYVVFDSEHMGTMTLPDLRRFALMGRDKDISIWVRPPQQREWTYSQAADSRVRGFMIPNMNGVKRLKDARDQIYFPDIADIENPLARGYGADREACDGHEFETFVDYYDFFNNRQMLAPQIEHPKSIRKIKKLMEMGGVDGNIIGPNDLVRNVLQLAGREMSTIKIGDTYYEPESFRAYADIAKGTIEKGKAPGIHWPSPETMDLAEFMVANYGYRLMLLGVNDGFKDDRIAEAKNRIRELEKSKTNFEAVFER